MNHCKTPTERYISQLMQGSFIEQLPIAEAMDQMIIDYTTRLQERVTDGSADK